MSPDPKRISLKLLDNPQDLNAYTYTINNPLRYFDPDGKDWKDVLTKLGNAISFKVSFGFGLGGSVTAGSFSRKAEISAKTNLEASSESVLKVSISASGEAGLTADVPGKPGVSVHTKEFSQTLGTLNNDHTVTGAESPTIEPAGVSAGNESATANNSNGNVTVGAEYGEGFLVGFEAGYNKAIMAETQKAFLDQIYPAPPPPPPPTTPAPPPICGDTGPFSCNPQQAENANGISHSQNK